MKVTIRNEAGYNLALYGLSLSFKDRAIRPDDWWCFDPFFCSRSISCDDCKIEPMFEKMVKVANGNAGRGKGHDKFLRQIFLWIDIEAPLSWWKQADQYKVGTVTQSESTMHMLHKRDATLDDFEETVSPGLVEVFNTFKNGVKRTDTELNDNLPLGYKQRRLVTLNYQNLRDIITQRKNHKLKYWAILIDAIYAQCEHSELLPMR